MLPVPAEDAPCRGAFARALGLDSRRHEVPKTPLPGRQHVNAAHSLHEDVHALTIQRRYPQALRLQVRFATGPNGEPPIEFARQAAT